MDADCTNSFQAVTKATGGDLILYAKWSEKHDIDRENGTVIKQATESETGTIQYKCKNCSYAVTEEIPKLTKNNEAESFGSGEKDVKGSSFAKIQVKADKTTKNSIRLKWNKVKGADGYIIYGSNCNGKKQYEQLKVMKNGSKTTFTQKKLKKGKYYKYIVSAYQNVNGERVSLAISKTVHATTTGGKYGNARSVKVNDTKVELKKNKTFKIKASEVAPKGKKIDKHRPILFESSDKSIATVTRKGTIKAKKKGTCYIYAYAQNGVYKKITVKVK